MRVSISASSVLAIGTLAACFFVVPSSSGAAAAAACEFDSPINITGFDTNSSALPKGAEAAIDKLAKEIAGQNCKVTITGFASGGPSEEFAKKLGLARAKAVAARLASANYPRQLVKVEFGSGNRLVQIKVAKAQGEPTSSQPQATISEKEVANSDNGPSPFSTAFAVASPVRAKPYDPFLPGFWIGFDDKKKSVVYLSQVKNSASDKEQYFVRILVEDGAGSDWVSFERTIKAGQKFRGKIVIRALANKASQVQLALFIPRSGGKKDKQVDIGTVNLGKKLKSFEFPVSIDPKTTADIDASRSPRIVAFLPKGPKSVVELSRFEVVSSGAN